MPELKMITNDGESAVGTTTITKAMALDLSDSYGTGAVKVGIGGDFFRRATVSTFEELGRFSIPQYFDEGKLAKVVGHVLANVDLYKDEGWGNLAAPHISDNVSTIGRLGIMQAAFNKWLDDTITKALDEERKVLILDGRNLRERAREFITSGDVISAVDVLIYCQPDVAAIRSFKRSHPGVSPTAADIEATKEKIIARRKLDRERPDYPFVKPDTTVMFNRAYGARGIVEKAHYFSKESGFPLPVLFDTTHMEEGKMKSNAAELAKAALEVIN